MTDTHTYCDRCGREIKRPYVPQIRVLDYDKGTEYVSLDVCKSCMRGFWNFMEKRVLSYSDISKEDFT